MAPGQPNEVSVLRNIQAAYDFAVNGLLWDPERIVFFGRSIGTGPAVALASQLK
jgi:abhydrolase domain-containing protein 17